VDFNRTNIQLVDEFRKLSETSVLTVMFTDIKGFTSITEDKGGKFETEAKKTFKYRTYTKDTQL
jgi:hypothetical protein